MKNTRRQVYCVHYKMHSADKEHLVDVVAESKEDAWDIAVYEKIPEREEGCPYSAWVSSVTYQNGNCRRFNTFEGKPY